MSGVVVNAKTADGYNVHVDVVHLDEPSFREYVIHKLIKMKAIPTSHEAEPQHYRTTLTKAELDDT